MVTFDESLHVIENNLRLTSLIGAKTSDKQMNLQLSPSADARAREILLPFASKKYMIGFQLGANFVGKLWRIEYFSRLGRNLVMERNAGLVVIGGLAEKNVVKKFCHEFGMDALAILSDLETVSAVIKRLDVFVTPDTGPMHIAFAMGCPTVSLFGPTNPLNFGPLTHSENCVVLHKSILDRPSIKIHDDPEDRMGKISVAEVESAIIRLLKFS
tara:strand:+ start:366 stop:1007 length:642 start_codon:yes stop_codon:yes gene_type:complete